MNAWAATGARGLRRLARGGWWWVMSRFPTTHERLRLSRTLRAGDAIRYDVFRRVVDPQAVALHPRSVRFPVWARLGTSDLDVFRQIFVERAYAAIDDLDDIRLVIDCGAYVGYSTAYFLSRFPQCRAIAVEPNLGNRALLERNLAPYGSRVRIVEGAVWPERGALVAGLDLYRDGREWTFHVAEAARPEDANIRAFTMPELLRLAENSSISILKMDIEGAEGPIFARGAGEWIRQVETLIVELHDDSPYGPTTPVVQRVLREYGFSPSTGSGELNVFRRAARASASAARSP